jgi:P-type E1-E2 ATPase
LVKTLFKQASSIIVYRSSPNDKADIIKFVMEDREAFTLAIGDGANDVNMI